MTKDEGQRLAQHHISRRTLLRAAGGAGAAVAAGVTEFDGKTYGYPWTSHRRINNLLLYNTELLNEAGFDPSEIILSWNDFLVPLVLTLSRPELRTLAVGVYSFQGKNFTARTDMATASTISLVPVIVVFLFLQRGHGGRGQAVIRCSDEPLANHRRCAPPP